MSQEVTKDEALRFAEHALRNWDVDAFTTDQLEDLRDALQFFLNTRTPPPAYGQMKSALETSTAFLLIEAEAHRGRGDTGKAESCEGQANLNRKALALAQEGQGQ